MNFVGVILFIGVVKIIIKDIVNLFDLDYGEFVILVVLFLVIVWNLIIWYFGIFSSFFYVLIGFIVGVVIVLVGFVVIEYSGFIKIIVGLLVFFVFVFVVGYMIYLFFKVFLKNLNLVMINWCFWMI